MASLTYRVYIYQYCISKCNIVNHNSSKQQNNGAIPSVSSANSHLGSTVRADWIRRMACALSSESAPAIPAIPGIMPLPCERDRMSSARCTYRFPLSGSSSIAALTQWKNLHIQGITISTHRTHVHALLLKLARTIDEKQLEMECKE